MRKVYKSRKESTSGGEVLRHGGRKEAMGQVRGDSAIMGDGGEGRTGK